jgi:hypothetical protein
MGFRSYVLAGLAAGVEGETLASLVCELESMNEVCFVEPVVGAFDLVILVESDSVIEETIRAVLAKDGIAAVSALKVNPIPARIRMKKNMGRLPVKSTA